jgi:branched-subunit amino acid ABC-type transport system permease component
VFSGALIVLLRQTLLGKGVRALMQSPTGAQLVGINTRVLHPLMFGIGLGLSGVAGALLSMAYTISPSMGEPYTVTALIVITLGGFGSMAARSSAACCWAWSRRSACTSPAPRSRPAVLRRVHRRAAAAARRDCSRANVP